tara:strand:+ start:60 stop:227 length:168 start_codon:yes stop_codon:yes gene_type:complete
MSTFVSSNEKKARGVEEKATFELAKRQAGYSKNCLLLMRFALFRCRCLHIEERFL